MAETLLSIELACKELQLGKEQVVALVKQGALRAFRDGKTYKFRREDVDAFRKKAESSATVIFDEDADGASDSDISDVKEGVKHDTSKIDLADIDAEPGADDSDQTSVLQPVDTGEGDGAGKDDESPVFDYSEDDLGLTADLEAGADEGDQTSLMAPAEGGEPVEDEESPVFEFSGKDEDLSLGDAPADSVLVADESESSLDILEVADESSSDTESSQSEIALADESSSGEDVIAVEHVEESSDSQIPVAVDESDTGAAPVSDLLGGPEEGSDELLETVDLDDGLGGAQEEVIEIGEPETAETVPLGEEVETVSLPEEDTTQFVGEPEAEAVEDDMEAALEEAADEEAAAPAMVSAGWDLVVPSAFGNTCLAIGLLLLAFGGWLMMCEVGRPEAALANPIRDQVIKFINDIF